RIRKSDRVLLRRQRHNDLLLRVTLMASAPESERRDFSEVTILLVICGIVGLILVLTGPAFFIFGGAWTPLIGWLQEGKQEQVWKPALAIGSTFIGLLVMFMGLQSARKFERTDATLRRLIYGYNAVLNRVLLLVLLSFVNAAVYIWFPRFLDTTEGGFYSLSEKSKEYVAQLDRPVQVYLVMPEGSETFLNTRTMLEQMHDLNPKYFNFEEISP